MKTKEELNALKEEVEELNKKLVELSDEDLEKVSGGGQCDIPKEWRLDGNLCYEDCRGSYAEDDCPYQFCPRDRWW